MTGLGYAASGDPAHPPVLFLHGFMGSSADWRGVTDTLQSRHRCVAVDLPGHGSSLGLSPDDYAFEGAARAVLDLLDELGVARAALAGYSMGGRLALYLALRNRERFSGLFLESASPGLEGAAERRARRQADDERARQLESGGLKEFLARWYGQPLFASLARNERLLGETIEARLGNDPGELARSLRGMGTGNQPSLWGELAALTLPTLAVAGGLDQKYVGVSNRMASRGPHITSAVFPSGGTQRPPREAGRVPRLAGAVPVPKPAA